jgi:hypothetical protein
LNDKEMNIQKLISDELNEMVVKREGETEWLRMKK